ncbi:MAG: hypothetical protein KIT22_19375, partial [Verrucomicrobiae bacterium]|nr:hypothetical protein [Verrucomicrobiae bacterium]
MRIIQLISGTGQGGADRVAVALGAGLQQSGHAVEYAVNPEFLKYQPQAAERHLCRVIPKFRGLPWSGLKAFKSHA